MARSFRRIIGRRLINVVITILGIMTLNFMLIHLMPGDPILNIVPRDPKFDARQTRAFLESLGGSAPEAVED